MLQLLVIWTTLALIELCLWIRLKYFVTGLFKTKYLSKDKVRPTYVNVSPMCGICASPRSKLFLTPFERTNSGRSAANRSSANTVSSFSRENRKRPRSSAKSIVGHSFLQFETGPPLLQKKKRRAGVLK